MLTRHKVMIVCFTIRLLGINVLIGSNVKEEMAKKTLCSISCITEIKFLAIHRTKILQIYVQLIIAPLPIRAHEGNPLETNKLFNRWSAAPKINQIFLQSIQ